jgi:hypothetical protein
VRFRRKRWKSSADISTCVLAAVRTGTDGRPPGPEISNKTFGITADFSGAYGSGASMHTCLWTEADRHLSPQASCWAFDGASEGYRTQRRKQVSHLADNSRGNALRNLRLLALTIAIMSLPLTTGCWVQSVYPFYEESDVVVDPGLVGNWEGDSELKSYLLKIGLDPAARTYTIEVAKLGDIKTAAQCQGATFEGKLVQIGAQRFLDVVPDQEKCWAAPLDSLMKVETDEQKLVLTPLDPDWMANAMADKSVKLLGRTREFGVLPRFVAVTLVSSTSDLRDFLRAHGSEKSVFSETGRMAFQR